MLACCFICVVVEHGVVAHIMKHFKPIAEYGRDGNLYTAEMVLQPFSGQDQGKHGQRNRQNSQRRCLCCQCGRTLVGNECGARLLAPFEEPLGGGEVCIDEADEEVQPFKHATSNSQASAEMVEQHRADHLLFRSWCKFCVGGRGAGQPHTTTSSESTVPTLGMDYFFIAC